ncbi:hypothetical protein BO86DRAFT_448842 [Aspergillus japonicus CBS 114.51]|uniref:Zn(2)-C6 fungal-type domain-containing protein n=1 Tax=Aspergillus japonicus CBS 114.51 TaxID=1448312 RepID=A0A8T8WYX7_ASPJA|nr:hypothetical protein BO86DRAFT_448842 [Aspergillus japonicus CBS 114.51]RAH80850.1 hypothetical protein BO86DRAFT_448842 [Aspergillus japonicus CBS 114.51]
MTSHSPRNPKALRPLAPAPSISPVAPDIDVKPIKKRSNACEACKRRKTKCLGEVPCDKCLQTGTECRFVEESDRRKKLALRRFEQELSSAHLLLDRIHVAYENNQNAELGELFELLQDRSTLVPKIEAHTRQKVQDLEERVAFYEGLTQNLSTRFGSDVSDYIADSVKEALPSRSHASAEPQRPRSASSSSSMGSLDEVDTLNVDVNRDRQSRSTGFIGKGSEIAWLQRLDAEVSGLGGSDSEQHVQPDKANLSSLNYHLDHLAISEPSQAGDLYAMPPKPWADQLLDTYFLFTHTSFPILLKSLFYTQYESASGSRWASPRPGWLVILNLVFAIGATHLQLRKEHWEGELEDRNFLAKAIALNEKQSSVLDDVDLQQVQIRVLFALYYLGAGQISRSWQLVGCAARSAIALGLNLRVIDRDLDSGSKEFRSRLWWSIVDLEQLLCTATGRTSCIDWHCCSVTAPIPFDEDQLHESDEADRLLRTKAQEQELPFTLHATPQQLQERTRWLRSVRSNSSLFFFYTTDLAVISHAAISAVYSLQSLPGTRSESHKQIKAYQYKLTEWLSCIHEPWTFSDSQGHFTGHATCREQVLLAFSFYSTQIVLNRPCLTRPEAKNATGARRPRSWFDNDRSLVCLQSAMDLISILPDAPDMGWLYTMAPWWSIVHYLMQASVIILLQLCVGPVGVSERGETTEGEGQGAEGTAEEPETILQVSKKFLRWLSAMGHRSSSARNAFLICDRLFRKIAAVQKLDLGGDLPASSDLADGTAADTLQHYYVKSLKTGYGHLPHQKPLSGRRVDDDDDDGDQFWGADYTAPEGAVDERDVAPSTLDPALLEVYEALIRESPTGDDLFFRHGP